MNETQKLQNAAALMEEMTEGRQTLVTGAGGGYIRTADDANFGLQMRVRPDFEQGRYQITFDAYSRRMGTDMDSAALQKLMAEAGQLHALMTALELQTFRPTAQEYQQFLAGIEPQEQETAPMMEQTF